MPKISQLDPSRNEGAEVHQQRRGESSSHQTGSDQQGCLSESWLCFSGNATDYLGFRVSLYGLMDQTKGNVRFDLHRSTSPANFLRTSHFTLFAIH